MSQIAIYNQKFGEDRVHFLKLREIENYVLTIKSILKTLKEKSNSKLEEIKTKVGQLQKFTLKIKYWN